MIYLWMSSFYQSALWRSINETIYKKSMFELALGGNVYRGISKQMHVWGQELRRSMIHGMQLSTWEKADPVLKQDLLAYQRDHRTGRDLFLQLGIDFPLLSYPTHQADQYTHDAQKKMSMLERDLLTRYDFRPTCREHMPHATVVLSTQGGFEERKRACSVSGKRMVNKGQKAGLAFFVCTEEQERRLFWQSRYTMSYDKGFSIISEQSFVELMHMLTTTGQGRLFIAKKNDQIVSGSVCLAYDKQLIYLYGATDRAWGNIGAHYRLTLEILAWARDHGFVEFDLFGIAPPGTENNHHLAGVTRFKQSFGGTTIVYAGSYDCVCSSRGYRAFKTRRTIKG